MAGELVERVIVATPTQSAGGRIIASPFQFFFDGNTNLRIEGRNSLTGVTLRMQGLFFTERSNLEWFTRDVALTNDRMRTAQDFGMGKGFLQTLVVTAVGAAPVIGQTFTRVTVILGLGGATLVLGTMLQGYVTSQQGLGWPGSPIRSSLEEGGYLRAFAGTAPAAGAVVSETVPSGARWQVRTVGVRLTTDATA